MTEETIYLHATPTQTKQPFSIDDVARTVTVTWLSNPDVARTGYDGVPFIQRLDPATCDLSRLNSGSAPLTDSHLRVPISAQLGVVRRAWFEGGKGMAELAISHRSELDGLWRDVSAGIIRNCSIETKVSGWSLTPATATAPRIETAVSWMPIALSLVTIGADSGAVTMSFEKTEPKGERMNETVNTTADHSVTRAAEIATIRTMAKPFGLPSQLTEGFITRGLTREQAGTEILNELVARSNETQIDSSNPAASYATVTRDHGDGQFVAMADALVMRSNSSYKPVNPDQAREFVSMSLTDMAAQRLRAAGQSVPWTKNEVVSRAMTVSDFPALLTSTGDRTLRQAYEAAPAGVLKIALQRTARDFRAVSRLQLSSAPTLLEVPESAEFTQGSMAESKESYRLRTFGRIVALTRQSIVNDDLQAFQSLMGKMGVAAKQFEAGQMVSLLTSNPVMSDSVALFDTAHHNLGTGAPTALSVAALTAARKAMRLQKGLSGEAINATPRWLVVPASLETTGEQVLTLLNSTKIDDVNPFGNAGLSLIVDPRLDAAAGGTTAWYLATDVGQLEHLEYAYLESQQGVRLESRWGFEVDALQTKISLDFGCAATEFRGLYKSTGV